MYFWGHICIMWACWDGLTLVAGKLRIRPIVWSVFGQMELFKCWSVGRSTWCLIRYLPSLPAWWEIPKAHRHLRGLELAVTFLGLSDVISIQGFREKALIHLSVRKQATKKTGEPAPQIRNKVIQEWLEIWPLSLETTPKSFLFAFKLHMIDKYSRSAKLFGYCAMLRDYVNRLS